LADSSTGTDFENEIRRFMDSLKIADVPKPKEKLHLGGQEIDAFGRCGKFYIVVDAKSKTSLKKKGRNVRKHLSVINGYRNEVIEDIKKRYKQKYGYRDTAFIFWTNELKIDKKHQQRATKLGIALRDDFDLKYYKDAMEILQNEEVVRNSFLADIQMQLPKLRIFPRKHPLDVKAIRTEVGPRTLYTFPIEVERLLRLGYVFRIELNSILGSSYQRLLKGKKISKIRDYLKADGYFPNNIVAISREKLGFDEEKGQEEDEPYTLGLLHVPDKPCYIEIIDGQHRLYGYANQKDKMDECLWVTIIEGLSDIDRAKLFVIINKTQTPVPPDILWDLYQISEPKHIRGRISKFVYELNETETLSDLISLPRVRSSTAFLSFSNFCGSLYKRTNLFSRYGEKTNFKQVLEAFFSAISSDDQLKADWNRSISNKAKKGFLCTNNSIAVLLRLLARVLRKKKKFPKSQSLQSWKKSLNKSIAKPLRRYLAENTGTDPTDPYGELRRRLTSEAARMEAAGEIWDKSPLSK
jgi:DNA sulfur modification protein DndB